MDFFISNYDINHVNFNAFDESYVSKKKLLSPLSSTIDTSNIDQYRQGIEIVTQKFFDKGICKIHAGEPGHLLNKSYVGIDKSFRQEIIGFSEIDTLNPKTFINDNDYMNNVVISDANLTLYDVNGIIEPLDIRTIILNHISDEHNIKGNIDSNAQVDVNNKSSQILSCDYFQVENNFNYFIDSGDIGPQLYQNVVVNDQTNNIEPFFDQKLIKDMPQLYDDSIGSALCKNLNITSSYQTTDNYIQYNKISMCTGFLYDSVQGLGTDSIVFGGLTY